MDNIQNILNAILHGIAGVVGAGFGSISGLIN